MNQKEIGKDGTKGNPQKDHKKMISIAIGIMLLIIAMVFIFIYARYNTSRYDEDARKAWMTASTSVSEFLHVATAIPRNDYCVDSDTYYELSYRKYDCIHKIGEFHGNTREGEKVDSLSKEVDLSIDDGVDSILSNADIFYNDRDESNSNTEDYYQCSPEEINSLKNMFRVVPKLHDQINEEMGFYTGISRLFEIGE